MLQVNIHTQDRYIVVIYTPADEYCFPFTSVIRSAKWQTERLLLAWDGSQSRGIYRLCVGQRNNPVPISSRYLRQRSSMSTAGFLPLIPLGHVAILGYKNDNRIHDSVRPSRPSREAGRDASSRRVRTTHASIWRFSRRSEICSISDWLGFGADTRLVGFGSSAEDLPVFAALFMLVTGDSLGASVTLGADVAVLPNSCFRSFWSVRVSVKDFAVGWQSYRGSFENTTTSDCVFPTRPQICCSAEGPDEPFPARQVGWMRRSSAYIRLALA